MSFFVSFLFSVSLFVPTSFAYFQLVLQWPPSYCYDRSPCRIPFPTNFTIHGLWQSYSDEQNIICPVAATLNTNLITKLRSELHREWPNLNGNDICFWRHEWKAHGMYSGLDPFSYFETTLELKNSVDLLRYLDEAKITPSNEVTYTSQVISEAIWNKIGFKPRLWCKAYRLLEISICVDYSEQNFRVIDCPQILLSYQLNFCPANGVFIGTGVSGTRPNLSPSLHSNRKPTNPGTTAVSDGFVQRNPSTTPLTLIFCFIFLLV